MTADGAAEAYKASLDDPSGFWASEADRYHWQTPFDRNNVYSANFKRSAGPIAARWFEDGATNIAYNCLDRQVEAGLGDKLCFIAERNDEGETSPLQPETYTYAEALEETKKLAAALRARGVKKGDRVALFMPMVPELAIAMLACARIGAVHTVVFGGFSRDSLASRIASAGATCVIAADGVRVFDGAAPGASRRARMSGKSPGVKGRPLHVVHDVTLDECVPARALTIDINRGATPWGVSIWHVGVMGTVP